MTLASVARMWQLHGVSVIPILANRTKRPSIQWREFQLRVATDAEISEWWGNGHPYGIALICGQVSGNLEMCEIEGRVTQGQMTEVRDACDELGVKETLKKLINGYSQRSPTGGMHLLYRISDHPVPGNEKIARNEEGEVLAETRGEGGYVIGAPSPGSCHPSGHGWEVLFGEYGKVPEITWEERCLLHEAIRRALDCEDPVRDGDPPSAPLPRPLALDAGAGVRPGDDFETRTTWAEILEPHGWRVESKHGHTTYWTRPGKDPREGASATTGHAGDRDRLYVFSTSTVFPVEQSITKFRAFSILEYGGDDSAAAANLARRGFGDGRPRTSIPDFVPDGLESTDFTLDDVGNSERLGEATKDRYLKVVEDNAIFAWDGRAWVQDDDGGLTREMVKVTESMLAQARDTADEPLLKWAKRSRSRERLSAACSLLPTLPGRTKKRRDFDIFRSLVNVENGILDLRTRVLMPHDPKYMMTRVFGASYNPNATCPRFVSFMEDALPDEEMRTYVQRALGYSLLGDVDQRAMFLVYGPSGTGKSTLMETMRAVFGDYGTTAPPGAFREHRDSAPTNDLHGLRGRRFVTTSETAETTNFNEDLLKRLTGQDSIMSRELYQRNQEWVPECVLWLATNHPPKFTSDDDAIWRRAKLIPFMTQFLGPEQVMGMARNHLIPEADGILNWLLDGLQEFLEYGLMEPEEVGQHAQEQRVQSDSAARFLEEKTLDGILLPGDGKQIKQSELFAMYVEWARQNGERSLGRRRFTNRLISFAHLDQVSVDGVMFWDGVARATGASILGSWGMPQIGQ